MSASVFACLIAWVAIGQDGQETITPQPVLPNGQVANAPFRPEHRQKNWTTFGLGNCVVASCCQNSKYLGHPEWAVALKSQTDGVPGGHYPEKLERVLQAVREKYPNLRWTQWNGQGDEGYRRLMEWSAAGFPIGITWGTGERYGYRPIAHMVSLTHADEVYWQVADNNFIDEFSSVPAPEGRRRWGMGSDEWAVVIVPPDDEWPTPPNVEPMDVEQASAVFLGIMIAVVLVLALYVNITKKGMYP